MIVRYLKLFSFSGLVLVLTGCPRLAYVEAYNNTKKHLAINAPSLNNSPRITNINPGQVERFSFGGNYLEITSHYGTWIYPENIPHSGNDGPYFDGTLRIQINPDGTIYALKRNENPPLAEFPEQPEGYPLHPE